MKVDLTVELKGTRPLSDELLAAETDLRTQFANVTRRIEDAPSVGFIAKSTCRGERAVELLKWLSGFAQRHPRIVVFAAYEMDDMYCEGGYLLYHGGRQITHDCGDCEHLMEARSTPFGNRPACHGEQIKEGYLEHDDARVLNAIILGQSTSASSGVVAGTARGTSAA